MTCRMERAVFLAPALCAGLLFNPLAASGQETRAPGTQRDRQLEESQSTVRALQARVEQLERRLDALAAGRQAARAPASPAPGMTQQMSQQRAQATAPAPRASQRTSDAPVPGSFAIDEDAAQRALERTLTQAGALLLPPGAFTVTPGFSYARNESRRSELVQITDPGTGSSNVVLIDPELRRNEFGLRLGFKAGLPWDAQLELDLPYQYVRASSRSPFSPVDSDSGSGFGDASIGVARTFLREKGALPDLIGRLSYNTGSGRRQDGRVTLSGGYPGLTAEVVVLKRQDPLAFFGSLAYSGYRDEDGIDPGNLTALGIGTVLAASPATSLQLAFTQVHRENQKLYGVKQPGTEQTYGVLSLGASSVLTRDTMLITSVGIGVGDDAPNYSINVSLPITFR